MHWKKTGIFHLKHDRRSHTARLGRSACTLTGFKKNSENVDAVIFVWGLTWSPLNRLAAVNPNSYSLWNTVTPSAEGAQVQKRKAENPCCVSRLGMEIHQVTVILVPVYSKGRILFQYNNYSEGSECLTSLTNKLWALFSASSGTVDCTVLRWRLITEI